jgi:hypothetical protein
MAIIVNAELQTRSVAEGWKTAFGTGSAGLA